MAKISRKLHTIDRKGSMPFALVAVTILLAATAYGIIASNVMSAEKTAEDVDAGIEALGKSSETFRANINRGLGEIIYQVSIDPELGNLSNRNNIFSERADRWMSFQFPMTDSGVTVTVIDYELNLQSAKMNLGGNGSVSDGYTPTYLKATGKIHAEFESCSGKSVETIPVITDGSCALPLCVETGSLFENAVKGCGNILSQMVTYQLTSLAQYRVINGYGAFSQYGEKGTNSLLTPKDVESAYNNSINALECMYFRDSSGKEYFGNTDLAKDLVSNNGRMRIDLNSIYAQALSAKIDDIVGKWFDYFLGNEILDFQDAVEDTIGNAVDSLISFFTGNDCFTARPYIESVAGNVNIDVKSGMMFQYSIRNPSTNEIVDCLVPYPEVDVYGSDCIKNFKSNYRSDNNTIRDSLTAVANKAVAKIASGKGLGIIEIPLNNNMDFASTVYVNIDRALQGSEGIFVDAALSTIGTESIPDPFYAAIYDTLYRNRDALYHYSSYSFTEHVIGILAPGISQDLGISEEEARRCISDSSKIESNRNVVRDYQESVDSIFRQLDRLNHVNNEQSTFIKGACSSAIKCCGWAVDCKSEVRAVARAMCSEYSANISINPQSGFTEIPTKDYFEMNSEGSTFTEKLSISTETNPEIYIGRASNKSSHETAFVECRNAGFTTVIPVSIHDTLIYTVESSGGLLYSLGMHDSAYSNVVPISLDMDVSVVSGWALAGVDYTASSNFLEDLRSALLTLLEPLLKPLRELMAMAENVMEKLSQMVMMISQYVTECLEKLYDAIIGPFERMNEMVMQAIGEVFCEQIISITEGAEALVDISMVGQTLGFTYMGYTVKFTFNMATWEKYTKNIVKAEFEGNVNGTDVSAFINVKIKGEDKKTPFVTAGFSLNGDDWDLSAKIDPKMSTNKCLVSLSGTVQNTKIDATLPKVVQYNEIDISLSDFPGIGTILSNIPSPIPGTKLQLDAGLNLKYNVPIKTGIIINEFESNPAGNDADHEWVEILNLSGNPVNMNNWTITTSKGKVHVIKDVQLSAGERTVIYFKGTFLVNSKEYLILKDPDGVEIDRSATMNDAANDNRTCQRGMDGSTEWALIAGTENTANKGGLFGENGMVTTVVKNIVKKAAVKAMNEMKHVQTTEALQELLTRTVKYAVDDGINTLANCLVEGSIYVSVDFTDVTSSGHTGFRVAIMVDSDIVGDILKYLLGKAEALFLKIDDPYNIDIDSVPYDDVYLGVSAYTGIRAPSILCASKNYSKELKAEVGVACNLSTIGKIVGDETGTPKIKSQIGIKNCPYELIPKSLGAKKNMTYDYWFISLTLSSPSKH